MQLKKWSKWLVVSGTLIIWLIKFIIRPYIHIPALLKPLSGISPNLIGAFLLPFGARWLFNKYFVLRTLWQLKITCLFGLALVVMNEYLQMIPLFGRTFDYMDILASAAGVSIGYAAFARLMVKYSVVQQEDQLV